jgi:hypothetical protein
MSVITQDFQSAERARRGPLLERLMWHIEALAGFFERSMEGENTDPASELGLPLETRSEMCQQSEEETAALQRVDERSDTIAPDPRITELKGLVDSSYEWLLFLENENGSLRNSLELFASENRRLCGRLTESEALVGKVYEKFAELKTALRAALAERDKLTAAIAAANRKPRFENIVQAKERQVRDLAQPRSKLIENTSTKLLADTITL